MKKSFAEKASDYIFKQLQHKSDDELREIIAECEAMTESNIGWGVYELKGLVSVMARAEIKRREKPQKTPPRKSRA